MKNELNFLIAIVLTILILTFYPAIIKQFAPQLLPDQQVSQPAAQPPVVESVPKTGEMSSEIIPSSSYSRDKSYIIESNNLRVTINSPLADISRIELKNIPDPATGEMTVLAKTSDLTPGIFADTLVSIGFKLDNVQVQSNAVLFNYLSENGLRVKKLIFAPDNAFAINLDYEIINSQAEQKVFSYQVVSSIGLGQTKSLDDKFSEAVSVFEKGEFRKNLEGIKSGLIKPGKVRVSGLRFKYFSQILAPTTTVDYFYVNPGKPGLNIADAGVGISNLVLAPQSTTKQSFVVYAGPNDFDEMRKMHLGIEDVRGKGFFAGFSDLLLVLLRFLHNIFRNYGVAVIILSLLINFVLYPLTLKSLKSMKEMQVLQPEVEALRSKYQNDAQKLNKEIVELYKKHKVNYADGCLPLLLQMPVFFTLYNVLMKAIELRGAKFLWIQNLAAPDAFITFPQTLPFVGNSLNLLPIFMVIVSFVQQKMTTTATANDQQKAMGMLMPFFLGVIFYSFPSGLALYFLTNTIFSFGVQLVIAREKAKA